MPRTCVPASKASGATARIKVRRKPKNARYDRESIDRVLDRGLVAHVSFVIDGQPYCIPTLYARVGNQVFIHGSSASRMTRLLASGAPACVTVTILDGLVLARSAFEHSANYDSVVLLGQFHAISEEDEKRAAIEQLIEALLPGRWSEVRPPTRQELGGTAVLAMPINEASVKTRNRPPDDDLSPDAELDVWAGVIPVHTSFGTPKPSPGLRDGVVLSSSVYRLLGQHSRDTGQPSSPQALYDNDKPTAQIGGEQ